MWSFVGQFCDADLEVAFRKSTCYIRDLKGNDLLTGSRGTNLYSITLQDTSTPNPICLMAKASSSQAWLWHRRLSHLNFDTINLLSKHDIVTSLPKLKFFKNHLCSSCELGKAKRIEFLNKTLHAYFAQEGIEHQTSTARTPEQNGVVQRQNRTLVEAARTMLSAAKVPLFFLAEAIATCFTQNCSLIIPRHEKTPYHIINGWEPSDPVPKCPTTALEHDILSPGPQSQENVPQAAKTVTTSNELDLLFSPMFDELLNETTPVVLKSFVVTATDAPNQSQQQNTTPSTLTTVAANILPLNIQTILETTNQAPTQALTVTANENIIQAETNKEYAQVKEDEFTTSLVHRYKNEGRHPKGYSQHEGIDFEESFALVARLEAVWLFIAVGTPMATKPLDADLSGTPVDQMKYRSMVRALMYLTASRPDIVHVTRYCARYQVRPTERHLREVKQIFWYLKNTINMGLWYPKDTSFKLTALSDLNHTSCLDSHKSTSRCITSYKPGIKLVAGHQRKHGGTALHCLQ
ncbi:retrovirus-related pol polyprotein from transposon TNT 1-94 [Tanacetum coccineum]